MNTLKKITIGIILVTIVLLLGCYIILFQEQKELENQSSDVMTPELNQEARKIREEIIEKRYPDENYEIYSEIKIENYVISSVSSSERSGFLFFDSESDYNFSLGYLGPKDDRISYPWNVFADYYQLFWISDPNIAYVEVTYFIENQKKESVIFDTDEMFCWKIPFADCTYSVNYLNAEGKIYLEKVWEDEHVNSRILLNDTMYWNTGVICDSVPDKYIDGEITSTVRTDEIPVENNQSNFGVGSKYKISGETLEVCVRGLWYIFEKYSN